MENKKEYTRFILCLSQAFSHECQIVLSDKCFDQFIKTKLNWKSPFMQKRKKDAIESIILNLIVKLTRKEAAMYHK